jgi:hypothetical protein
MRFKPLSEEEIQMEGLIDPGQYSYQVIEATDEKSKSGNDMIKLKLRVWDANGKERLIFDYLLEAMAFKLRHFCEGLGLLESYNSGTLSSASCEGKCGHLELMIQKDKTGQYAPKNAVKDYIVKDKSDSEAKVAEGFIEDDLPF